MAIDELFDAFEVLQNAPGLTPSAAATPLAPLDVPLPLIVDTLHVPQARAMAIRIGKEPLTRDEAIQLAGAANLAVDDILAAVVPLPYDLARELQEPRWREPIRRRAVDGDEDGARTQLGYQAYQFAARETAQGNGWKRSSQQKDGKQCRGHSTPCPPRSPRWCAHGKRGAAVEMT